MSYDVNDKKIFVLEGNIGSGKSTFLGLIKKYFNEAAIIFEPTDKWQKVGSDGNLLDLFYKDTSRWAYTFQSYAFISRMQSQLDYMAENLEYKIFFVERSVYSDQYCFAKNCFESGLMSALEWQIYREWFFWLINSFMKKPAGFIYLRTNPQVCYDRLKKRNRTEEADVSLRYLQTLHDKHEEWLCKHKEIDSSLQDIPILLLDCSKEFENDEVTQKEHMLKISSFIDIVLNKAKEKDKQAKALQL